LDRNDPQEAKMRSVYCVGAVIVCALFSSTVQAATLGWSVIVDHPSVAGTRSLRSVALSQDESNLYAGYIQGSSTAGFRQYILTGPPLYSPAAFHDVNAVDSTTLRQAESVTTDDRGIVYGASIKDSTASTPNARITLMSSNFSTVKHISLADITSPPSNTTGETIGGIWLRKSGSTYQLYVTRFLATTAYVERYVVGGTGVSDATLTLDPTFDGDGQFNVKSFVPGATRLRGIEVADDGTIFTVSRDDDALYRIASDLSGVATSAAVNPMDVALFDGNVYVTRYDGAASEIVEYSQATGLATGETYTATGSFARGALEGYSGIDIDNLGRIYLGDQFYALDSDRVLLSSPLPEPGMAGGLLAGILLLRRRRALSCGG
jgi:hypothetical protein